jgi:WD40 repeat protein
MMRIRKVFNAKIIAVIVAGLLLCNITGYPYPVARHNLRVPVGGKEIQERIRERLTEGTIIHTKEPVGANMKFSPDGEYLAFLDSFNTLVIRRMKDNKEILRIVTDHSINDFVFLSNGKYLVLVTVNAIQIVSSKPWKIVKNIPWDAIKLKKPTIIAHPSEEYFIIADFWGRFRMVDFEKFKEFDQKYISEFKRVIKGDAAISPDGAYLVLTSMQEFTMVMVLDIKKWKVVRLFKEDIALDINKRVLRTPIFSSDGRYLGLFSLNHAVVLDNTKDWKEVFRCYSSNKGNIAGMAFFADKRQLALAYTFGGIDIYNMDEWNIIKELEELDNIRKVAFSPTGQHVALSSTESIIKIYDGNVLFEGILSDQLVDTKRIQSSTPYEIIKCASSAKDGQIRLNSSL